MASDTGSISSSTSRPKNYHCDVEGCDKSYSKPSLLEQHKRSHTNDRPFKCPVPDCGKLFLRKSHLIAHAISHETDTGKPFHCEVCGKGVNTQQHLKRHIVTHTKSFACPYCPEAFYKHQSLRHHILSAHEKTLSCNICKKTFTRPYRLAQHTQKYHSESPAYQCDHPGCFSNFKTWSALQLHIKSEHPKIKCPICGKGCVGKKGLKSHMVSHDDAKMVKLWNCNYCNMGRFGKKLDLIDHYNTFHDGNIPDDLLMPNEKIRLEELLLETDDKKSSLSKLPQYETISSDDDSEDDEDEREVLGTPHSHKSLEVFNSSLNSQGIIGLIGDNFASKKLRCPKKNCDRRFNREYDLNRHLKWHEAHLKKVEAFLLSLEGEAKQTNAEDKEDDDDDDEVDDDTEEQNPPKRQKLATPEPYNSHEEDDDLNSLIDLELFLLKAGDSL